jgi:ribose transport system ATP-binding protein/D-xylose transport system ATP-binding protein
MNAPDFAIQTSGITKTFSGVQALRGVDFRVRRGEIHALLGQNGAGKSTLVKILNGVYPDRSYGGDLTINNRRASFRSPDDARAAGVGYVPQEIEVLEQLTVAENVFAGRMNLGRGVLVYRREVEAETRRIFSDLGIEIAPNAIVAALTAAQRHLVMIARALALRPQVLMLDEPTASLSGHEVDALFGSLRRLRAQGVTMIYITHRLPEVMDICDSATVLRDGQVAAELNRTEFNEETFIFAMSGRRMQRRFPDRAAAPAHASGALMVGKKSLRRPWLCT